MGWGGGGVRKSGGEKEEKEDEEQRCIGRAEKSLSRRGKLGQDEVDGLDEVEEEEGRCSKKK